MNTNTASLNIVLGSMCSGKSTYLVEIYNECIFCNISVIAINSNLDNYHATDIATHNNIKIPCLRSDSIIKLLDSSNEHFNKIVNASVILINESQFFPDLYDGVKILLVMGKQIHVSGLDGDFKRQKFGQILDLIPLSDSVVKLKSLCGMCKNGTPGIFSKRIINETNQTMVGSEHYIPVCRKCYEHST